MSALAAAYAAMDVKPLLDEARCVVVVDVDGFDVHAPVSIQKLKNNNNQLTKN